MPTKKKVYSDDGDTAHWETAREKERAMKAPPKSGIYVQHSKRGTIPESGRTEKYIRKGKVVRKKVITKK